MNANKYMLASLSHSFTTLGWDADTNEYSTERKRQADVYVFALLSHRDKATLDPLNVAQWEFYVLPAHVLDTHVPQQKTISLATLSRLGAISTKFGEIGTIINRTVGKS